MATSELEALLRQIRDGIATGEDLSRARELLRHDARIVEELRADALDDEPQAAAEGLLALLGADDALLLTEALSFEAGGFVDVSAGVLAEIGSSLPLADAVRAELGGQVPLGLAIAAEAGGIDVADAVLARLGLVSAPVPVAPAVAALAGAADIASSVLFELRIDALPVAQAVRSELRAVDVSGAVLAELGLRDAALPIADAVRAEAGCVDVADEVLARLGLVEDVLPIGLALRAEAGTVDVVEVVDRVVSPAWLSAMLDHELGASAHQLATSRLRQDPGSCRDMTAFADIGRKLRLGVQDEAGPAPLLWGDIAARIGVADAEAVQGYDGASVAAAVRAECGTCDVSAEVMRQVRKSALAPVARVQAPANRGWSVAAVALAAVALVAVLAGRSLYGTDVLVEVEPTLQFAAADEIVVDDLSYGENATVQVFQQDEDGAALIIWVDEETL
jgi:hypothetical protein